MSAATHDERAGGEPVRVAARRFAGGLMFPGQGSQRIGMGRWMERTSPAAAEVFDVAARVLGRHVRALCFTGPARELTLTRNAQVAVFTTNAAAAAVLAVEGFEARLAMGHSVGELNALVAAGVLPLEDGLRLVAARGEIMGRIAAPGTMAAIVGLDQDVVRELCAAASGDGAAAVPALLNGPQNVVVSGDVAAVERCTELATGAGARSITKLVVSGAFHSPLMAAAVPGWSRVVAATPLREPRIPVVLNTTGAVATGADDVRRALVDQLTGPVRWVEDVRTALAVLGGEPDEALGIPGEAGRLLMEAGDSKVLTTLARGIEPDAATMTMHDPKTLRRLRGETPARQPRPQLAARW